jgi:hypothetical protein
MVVLSQHGTYLPLGASCGAVGACGVVPGTVATSVRTTIDLPQELVSPHVQLQGTYRTRLSEIGISWPQECLTHETSR